MQLENEAHYLERIAKAFRLISKEISYGGVASALLGVAIEYSGAVRGAVLLSEGGELLAKANASFPREKAQVIVMYPPDSEFRLPADCSERVLRRQETFIRHDRRRGSALLPRTARSAEGDMTVLCLPLIHQDQTIGVLYLEAERDRETFTAGCVSMMSLLASQAAVSFESAQLFEALRETTMWMVKGQQIARMGSYRWNTSTLLWRGSRECHRILGLDPNVNPVPFQAFRNRIHSDDLPALEQALAEAVSTQSPFSHAYRVVHKDGATFHVIAVGKFDVSPSGDVELEGIISDVTEQKAAEQALTDARAELARTARLASVGELAGSIVHEVNQPLTGIITNAEACIRWLARDRADLDEARNSALRVIEQGRRASKVISGLGTLVRDAPLQFAEIQINDAVEEILLLSKRQLQRTGIRLETDLDPSMPEIEADRVQLQQVILNLVRNAADAMAGIDGRARILKASTSVADGHASVTVADTGVGIEPASEPHLFDALYTTKDEGLGLGLSISRKIVAAHGGRIWLEKNTTQGATFTFALPVRQTSELSENN